MLCILGLVVGWMSGAGEFHFRASLLGEALWMMKWYVEIGAQYHLKGENRILGVF